MAPQPYYVEWSPSTVGSETPSWETLGRVYDLSYTRDVGDESSPVAAPSRMQCSVRASAKDGSGSENVEFDTFYRYTPIRVMFDNGVDAPLVVWTGWVTSFKPIFDDTPRALQATIVATDGIGLGGRDTVERLSADEVEGDFKGWSTNITEFVGFELNGDFLGTPEFFNVIDAPVMLPPKFVRNDDTYTDDAKFSEKALVALAKVLDVEMGQAGMSADGNLAIVGRYAIANALIDGAGPDIKFTGEAGDTDPVAMPWRRGSMEPADPYTEYKNWATTKGLSETLHIPTTVVDPAPEPIDSIDRLDLWCASEPWVQANADLLAFLYAKVHDLTIASLDVLLWDSTTPDGYPYATLFHEVTRVLGIAIAEISLVTPGDIVTSLTSTIVGVSLKVTSSQAIATVRFSQDASRWDRFLTDVPSGYKIFALDVAGAGLDAGATLGP